MISPDPTSQQHERERLVLLCSLDRAQLRMRLAKARTKPAFEPAPLAQDIIQITRLLPGPIGRWSRRFSILGDLLKDFI